MIHPDFARGYDILLAKDALVHIFANSKSLSAADAKQMAGRGTRMKGTPKAILYLVGDATINKGPWEQIEAHDAVR